MRGRTGSYLRIPNCHHCGADRGEVQRSQIKGEPIRCTEPRHKFTLSRREAEERDGS